MARARHRRRRVPWGVMTSSMKPRAPATKGLANLVRYSSVRWAILAGSPMSPRKMISTAPLGPITAISAVGLAGDDRHLRHGGFREGVQQLGAVLDDAAIFLRRARQETGNIDEGDDGDIEAVAEAHEARALDRGVDVEASRQHHRLVGDDAHRAPLHAR